MNINDAFPSRYLTAADLGGQDQRVTITEYSYETLGTDQRVVLGLQEISKKWVLNKTNAMTVAKQYGNEIDNWVGQLVTLYPTYVEVKGEQVIAIRGRPPAIQQTAAAAGFAQAAPGNEEGPQEANPFDL